MNKRCQALRSFGTSPSRLCGLRGVLCIVAICTWPGCSLLQQASVPQSKGGIVVAHTASMEAGAGDYEVRTLPPENAPSLLQEERLGVEEYVELGDRYRTRGKFPVALSHYQKALALDPKHTVVQKKIGDLFLDSNKPQEAKSYYARILEQQSDYAEAYEGLGQACLQLDQVDEAEGHLITALGFNHDLWKAHAFLGIIYDRKGAFSRSVVEHQKALALNPENPELYNNLGIAYFLMGQTDKAIPFFQRALRSGSEKSQIYNNLGVALSKVRKFPEAFAALQQGENDARGYNNVGVLMLKGGYAQQAIPCFERALDVQPNFYFKAHSNLQYARKMLRLQMENGSLDDASMPSPCAVVF